MTKEYLRHLIEQDLLADQSFDEILRPIREDFRKSGITERELESIVRRARRLPRPRTHQALRKASITKERLANS